jgi:hypothetical protein
MLTDPFAGPTAPVVAFLELEALVAWPRDAAARRRFLCAAAARLAQIDRDRMAAAPAGAEGELALWVEAWEALYQRHGGRSTLLDAPPFAAVLDEFLRATHAAWIAGRVLGFAVRLSRDPRTRAKASVNLAKEITRRHLPGRVATARPLPRSPRPVDDAWKTHRCVAPYACVIAGLPAKAARRAPDGAPAHPLPIDISAAELLSALQTMAAVQRLAAGITPVSRREPILPAGEVLPLPLPFAVEPAPEDEIEILPLPADYLERPGKKSEKSVKMGGLRRR